MTLSWPVGLSAWNSGSPCSKPPSADCSPGPDPTGPAAPDPPAFAAVLAEARAAGIDPVRFAAAVDAEARRRLGGFLDGVTAYRAHPGRREGLDPPAVWARGSARLQDFADTPDDPARRDRARDGPPVLLVPSLVNRGTILNLTRRRGFARYLAWRGLRPFLMEWGAPGPDEEGFGITEYVADRLEPAFAHVRAETGRRPLVLGYCMGGLLALALAQRQPEAVAGLALLATPWDFHASEEAEAQGRLARGLAPWIEAVLATRDTLPVDVLQAAFACLDPAGLGRKFRVFGRLPGRGAAARHFVAVEDWVNDGVPLAARVATETLVGWYRDNTPGQGRWTVDGQRIRPDSLSVPAYVVIPAHDRIVPAASARALARALPGAVVSEPPLGHVGMIVGRAAVARVHDPLVRWALRTARATT
ncbi:alpha/beta fold hydrolase [Roseospira navarrensis]|uniref:Alpha/beta fold hydrolase n=2 Tax=Roseospira navarrensis TaxID=140058 RepID=A0A7X1ZFZ3_9PROT|nr:alpha/beta fold hydrolase [Roseospira navarrensis]